MAILTRPLFHSQERIDLEDLVQLQSGIRTDARLWTRQLLVDKNFILKGFDVSGIGTNQIAVNLLDSTLLFAGRRDLTGVATIIVDGSSTVGDTITIANSDGSSFTITAIASGSNSATQYVINSDADIQAANIAESINLIGSGLASSALTNNITVTASRTGFLTIVASNSSNFNNNGNIIGTFDYASATIESPADLSYFILQSGATGSETSITREISASERALTGVPSKTLYVYGKLITEQGTPITKAFWDPSANSGSGAEFNQRVDTASDLAIELNVVESELDQITDEAATEFFANVAICQLEVDSSGTILSIRDTRPLFFEADDERPWDRANNYASMTLLTSANADSNISINVIIPDGIIPGTTGAQTITATAGTGPYTLDETVSFWPLTGSPTDPSTSAEVQLVSGTTTDFNKFDLSSVPSRMRIAIGETSGTIRIVEEVRSNFFRDDKAIGDFRNMFSALATEINNAKGTDNWYEDPPASIKDILRFINSTIIGIDPDARYSWTAADTADGTLSIRREPLARNVSLTVEQANGIVAAQTIVFTRTAGNITLTAVSSSPGNNQFLIGVDAEATASHLSSAINAVTNLSASFGQSGTDFVIEVGSNDNTISTVTSNATNIVVSGSPFVYTGVGNLANVKIYGIDADFFFTQQDLIIGTDEVLFITLPDLDDENLASEFTYDQTQFRYSISGPTIDGTAWNATNRALFETSTDRFKTVPVNDFVSNERNYWVAYRDATETIFVRDIGELGTGEAANIGHGISNATLSYIGAPDENTSTPVYPAVNTINAFPPAGTDGAYFATTSAADFNNTVVAQSENLTSAINDLNNHLTSIRDTQYQNLGLKLVNGGYFGWSINASDVGTLTIQDNAQVQVPGLADAVNNIASTNGITMELTGDVLYVDIRRQDAGTTPGNLAIMKANVNTARTGVLRFIPTRDRIVIARRLDEFVYIGTNGTIRLADDQAAPLDSALQFIGVNGQGGLPRQLNTAPVAAQTLSVGTSSVTFPTGGNITTGTTDDTSVSLELSISGGVLFWEGARFDFATGIVQDSNGNTPFRSRTGGNTTFSFDNLTGMANREVVYSISLDNAGTITTSTGADLLPGAIVTANLGKNLGEPNITKGDIGFTAGNGDRAIPAEFGGALPIAQVIISTDGSGAYLPIDMNMVTVLAASGSGGGGTGNAVQDINNYLNRLNLSTFGYFSALVPAVSTEDFVGTSVTTPAGIAAAGISLTAGLELVTTNLIDPEFIADGLIPERVEIEATWAQTTEFPITTSIDPNARWFISFNENDLTTGGTLGTNQFTPLTFTSTKEVVGAITANGTLIGTNLTNAPLTQIDTLFVENHGFSTGHKVSLTTTGGLVLTDSTNIYVHSLDADSFQLYTTVANADAAGTTGRIEIGNASTITGNPIFTRGEGIIPRIGHTNLNRVVLDQRDLTTIVGDANRRRGGAYDTTNDPSVRLYVVGDTDSATGSPEILMTSLALFYADELGVEGVNPNGLDDVNNILRSSHLVNADNANASYGVAGRGVVLLDTVGANKELSISSDDKLRINGVELSVGHVIQDGGGNPIPDADTLRTNLQFAGTTVTDDAANDRTIVNTQTLFQTKSITSNFATGTADVTALQFNNLEVGKQYRLSGSIGFGSGGSGAFDAFVLFRDATGGLGNTYGRSGTFNQGGQSTGGAFGVNIVFTATSTTIVPRTSFDNGGRIIADSSAPTFLTLEELPAHTVTTQWA